MDAIIGVSDRKDITVLYMRNRVEHAIRNLGGSVNARIWGKSSDDTWGEETAAWVSASIPQVQVPALRIELRDIANEFNQEAIALTLGNFELVEADNKEN